MTDEVVGFGQGGIRTIKLSPKDYGAKAARLAAMASCGLTIAPSVAIPISACQKALDNKGDISVSFQVDISRGVRGLQRTTRKWLGDIKKPLILAVRVSPVKAQGGLGMPVIFVGWTKAIVESLTSPAKKEMAARQMANMVRELAINVFSVDESLFDEKLEEAEEKGALNWLELYDNYLAVAQTESDDAFPIQPSEQLLCAVRAVWKSWYRPRAKNYRALYDIEDVGGIGVLIQVSIPLSEDQSSASGWISVRCEKTGENKITGAITLQDGSAKTIPVSEFDKEVGKDIIRQASQWEMMSARAEKLDFIIYEEKAYIIDGDALFMTTAADITFSVEMVEAGAISKMDAVKRIDPARLIDILHARIVKNQGLEELAQGLAASPGAASGRLAFSAAAAETAKSKNLPIILVKIETSPEDIRGMQAASAIVTLKGGLTSHAAVIARGTGKPCIVSLTGAHLEVEEKLLKIGSQTFKEGDFASVDGSTGLLFNGKCKLHPPAVSGDLSQLLEWADELRRMKVYTNVDTPHDAEIALQFGAEGIGLCRTEHMLFQPERLSAMRDIILSQTEEARLDAVNRLVPLLREDFIELFEVMRDKPVTIRLFDPPLHEFLPKEEEDIVELSKTIGMDLGKLRFRINELSETNPMLGNRGCRLLICNPQLAKTLVKILFEAILEVSRKHAITIKPEVMVPLVALSREFIAISRMIDDVAQDIDHKYQSNLQYKVGSMIELPRAAMIAERIASEADFFSFGTNDLTQTTFGISRDDAVAFLTTYEQMGLMDIDPFISIDEDGVGAVIEMAIINGRGANPDLQIGICGEHGGDPRSIHFFERLALDYISCSPFRVPIARLAAAQATLMP